ncbi:MAG: hypothetical protein JW737_04220 [Acidobacteria bacterium]|nr:hypothetical protein [Acidobacteriota bacterium]
MMKPIEPGEFHYTNPFRKEPDNRIELWKPYTYGILFFFIVFIILHIISGTIYNFPVPDLHLFLSIIIALFPVLIILLYNLSISIKIDNKERFIIYTRYWHSVTIPFDDIDCLEITDSRILLFTVYKAQFITKKREIYYIRRYTDVNDAKLLRIKVRNHTNINLKAPDEFKEEKIDLVKNLTIRPVFMDWNIQSGQFIKDSFFYIGACVLGAPYIKDINYIPIFIAMAAALVLSIPFCFDRIVIDLKQKVILVRKVRDKENILFEDIIKIEVRQKRRLLLFKSYSLYIKTPDWEKRLCRSSSINELKATMQILGKHTSLETLEPQSERYKDYYIQWDYIK